MKRVVHFCLRREDSTGRLVNLVLQRRAVVSGQMPIGGDDGKGWELRRGHHLQTSAGLHSTIRTACGRMFDPQTYHEMLQACCDHQWLLAIQRELCTDTEYMNYLRQHGGAARDMRVLTDSIYDDDEFMVKLIEKLKTDFKTSLSLCAIQASYERIRRKRDEHETQVAADGGRDPYASLKTGRQREFGSSRSPF
ncbi:unnamed protein product [Phytomonas sp. EM1]|nr:unnamed protein product [Phytomonas sp. EM1]|eukprot:CCW63433.1 unnamed protein product [Phytomonas sp. isolate EM1]